jgi:hypothetical protein
MALGLALSRLNWRRLTLFALVALIVAALIYYPVGMVVVHKIDADPNFGPGDVAAGGSRAVAVAAALIDREVNKNGWTANDPFFLPGALLDNMPNYQQGIISALARFAFELTDQIGRTRGSSQADPDLQEASGQLQMPGNKWVWDPSTSLGITATSEQQYRKAMRALSVNVEAARLMGIRTDRVIGITFVTGSMLAAIGAASAALDQRIEEHSGDFIDFRPTTCSTIPRAGSTAMPSSCASLGKDFDKVIADKDLAKVWGSSSTTCCRRRAAALVGGQWPARQLPWPSHPAPQGFFCAPSCARS